MTEPDEPNYATGGFIHADALKPLLNERGCSFVIPNRHDPDAVPQPIRFDQPIDTTSRAYRRFARRFALAVKADPYGMYLLNADGTRTRLGPQPTWKQRCRRAYYRVRMWLA